ncbi:MAG: hypothetical protein JXR37_01410 [Kiritimatiellae bacterium]|nr:hypothetical protein [Kiritimatiellia bacterium]
MTFTILARKAGGLSPGVSLPGWLWQTAMHVAGDILRQRVARARRERRWEAEQPDDTETLWERLAPELDAALGTLSERLRRAVIARYFLGKSHRDIGLEQGIHEDAARMRVKNGVEHLRAALAARGIAVTATVLVSFLSTRTVEAVSPHLTNLLEAAAVGAAAGRLGAGLGGGWPARLRALFASKPAIAAATAGAVGLGVALIGGQSVPPGWHVPACELRLPMDWMPADGHVPGETFEWAVELDKLGKLCGLEEAIAPDRVALVAEDEAGAGRLLSFDAQARLEPLNRTQTVFRFQPPHPLRRLWFYFAGKPPAEPPFAGRWNLLDGALRPAEFEQWQKNHAAVPARILETGPEPVLEFDLDAPARAALGTLDKLELTRRFPVAAAERGAPATVAIDLQLVEGFRYVPFRVALWQLDGRGARLPADVIDPRWLAMNAAVGQDVKLRETGRIHPGTEAIEVRIALKHQPASTRGWDELRTTAQPVPADERIRLRVRRLELRTGRRLPFPGRNPERYAAGMTSDPADRCLLLGAGGYLIFDPCPPGVWSAGLDVKEPAAFHWPVGPGTFECWVKPAWTNADAARGRLALAVVGDPANAGPEETVFEIAYDGRKDGGALSVTMRDGAKQTLRQTGRAALRPGTWHHLAFCWAPAAGTRELFLDGQSVSRADGQAFAALDLANAERRAEQMPTAVWIGSGTRGRAPFPAYVDELRVSDSVRYRTPFAPRSSPFSLDEHTRALWHFDGSQAGVHHGDDGVVAAALLAEASPALNVVEVHRRTRSGLEPKRIQWFPERLPPALDPQTVLPIQSYAQLDTAQLDAAYTPKRLTLRLAAGQAATVTCDAEPVMDYVELAAAEGEKQLVAPWLGREDDTDSRSLERIAQTLRLAELPDEQSRAIRLFAYLVAKTDYFSMGMYDWTPTHGVRHMYHDPHKLLNNYLQFICGALNRTAMHSFLAAGLSANEFPGSGHCFQQVFYDNAWHLYDLSPRLFIPARDNTRVAGLAEIQDDPYLLHRGNVAHWLPAGERGPRFMSRDLLFHDMTYALRPGESFRYSWWNVGRVLDAKTYEGGVVTESMDRFQPEIGNGVLAFACEPSREHPALSDWTATGFAYAVKSPYVIADSEVAVQASFARPGATVGIELSNDAGKTWRAVGRLSGADTRRAFNPKNWVVGRYAYALRFSKVDAAIERLEHRAFVQLNPRVLTPCLKRGANRLVFSSQSGAATIALGYREAAGTLDCAGGVGFGFIPGRARYLLAGRPGETCRLAVGACNPPAELRVPSGIESRAVAGGFELRLAPHLADGFYLLTLAAGARERRLDLLIGKNVALYTPAVLGQAAGVDLIEDPDVAGRRVLRLGADGERALALPQTEFAAGDYRVWALFKRPRGQRKAKLYVQAGDQRRPFRPHIHRYGHQEIMDAWWGWRALSQDDDPKAGGGTLPIAPGATLRIGCDGGQVLVAGVCIVPAADARLARLYLENYSFDPAFK